MNITKNILIFYSIILICFVVSSIGIYVLTPIVGKIYFAMSVFLIPLITVTKLYVQVKGKE